jgi:hypothetical protein
MTELVEIARLSTRSPHQFPDPESPLRESAQYLVADVVYKQKDWRGALAEFRGAARRATACRVRWTVWRSVPASTTKVPERLLRLGLAGLLPTR